jgi:hypothetical protein
MRGLLTLLQGPTTLDLSPDALWPVPLRYSTLNLENVVPRRHPAPEVSPAAASCSEKVLGLMAPVHGATRP